jgi:hypothetical protein
MGMFDGDGRVKVKPVNVPEGTRPMSVTKATGRNLAQMFDREGVSYHSAAGNVVWVIVTHCIEQSIPYRVNHVIEDGKVCGFTVEKMDG